MDLITASQSDSSNACQRRAYSFFISPSLTLARASRAFESSALGPVLIAVQQNTEDMLAKVVISTTLSIKNIVGIRCLRHIVQVANHAKYSRIDFYELAKRVTFLLPRVKPRNQQQFHAHGNGVA